MKILFFMRSTVYARNFESTLRLLAQRGHEVHIVADPHFLQDATDLVERLCREHSAIRHSVAPVFRFNAWSFLGLELRRALDYLRYLGPEFAEAPKLRQRAARNAPDFLMKALERPLLRSASGRRLLATILRVCDRAIPADPAIETFIRNAKPDLVAVTPLVEPGSPQAEYLRSARALGIPTALCVYSWDNLTNKGLIHDPLTLVTVWNEPMKHEAVALHRMPADRVVVTGAVPYDHWFEWTPRTTREQFCARVGLPPSRPYVLYLCSSRFIAPDEVPFVRRWITELRASSSTLRDAGVLVRPHPQNAKAWRTADLDDLPAVAVWPRGGGNPVDEDSRSQYFDSIYHSAAVVGVNTSAQIESAIVGRGVYTVLAPEFRETQEGTLHFHHLREVNGGLLHVAETFTEHVAQLEAAVRAEGVDDSRCRRFVEAFVRPHGIAVPAAPRLVSALEAAAAHRLVPDRGPWWGALLRPFLRRAATRLAQTEGARKEKTERAEHLREQREREVAAQRAHAKAAKERSEAERARRRQQHESRIEAERLASEAVAATAHGMYMEVRERIRRMGDGANGHGVVELTDVEQRTVSALTHLWDASPQTIACLRRYGEVISGVRAADYQPLRSPLVLQLRRDIRRLRRHVGDELFVQEPLTLGGFGYARSGERYNHDTLKFFTALVALQDGAVLGSCRGATTRRMVWEIGGGWGGFAYQFKTVCPNVTYLITGLPELLLMSATYLKALFPDARFEFFEPSSRGLFLRDWQAVDFAFAPESALCDLELPSIDLTVDLLTLQQMTRERMERHLRRAYESASRFFYSMMPASCAENPDPWRIVERHYWPHRIPPRQDAEPVAGVEDSGPTRDGDFMHLMGWRRIRTDWGPGIGVRESELSR